MPPITTTLNTWRGFRAAQAAEEPTSLDVRIGGTRREHVVAMVLLFLPVLWLLGAALLGGQVLTADSFLYVFAPWRVFSPADVTHFQNTILSDIPEYHYPWAHYVRSSLHAGTIPTWNTFTLSGNPFYANSQTGLTSITDIPLWFLPFNYAFGVVAAIKLWIAAAGAYLLARQFGLGLWAGLLAGVCYPFASFNIVWLEHMTLVASTIWLPWAVLVLERMLRRPSLRLTLAMAAVTALIIDGGHPGTELQMLTAAWLYGLVRAFTLSGLRPAERVGRLALAAVGTGVGALLMMFIVLPVIEASKGTHGAAIRAGGGPIEPLSGLRSLFFPDWWGRPSQRQYGGPVNYVERTVYDSVVGLVLAVLAVTGRRRWRMKLPLLVAAVVGPAVAYGVPGIHALFARLPVLNAVQFSRFTDTVPLGMALLAAFGMQALIDREPGTGRRVAGILAGGVVVAAVAVVALNPSLHDIRTTINHFRTGANYDDSYVLALTAVGWWLIFLAAVAAAAAIWQRVPSVRALAPALLLLLAVLDLHHFAAGLDPIGPASQIIPPTPPAVRFLQRHAGYSRVFGVNGALVADYTMIYGLRDPGGLDPPQPTDRYFNLWKVAYPHQNSAFGLYLPALTERAMPVLNVLGVRYVLVDPAVPIVHLPGLSPVYRGRDATIYESASAAPPAFVPSTVRRVTGAAAAQAAVTSASFDARRDAVVEGGVVSSGRGVATVDSDINATARITARLSRGGLVVRNDAWAPGWSVRVDGRPARLLRVNDVMQGVDVPAGRHVITFSYSVPGLEAGVAMSGVGALLLIAGLGVVIARRRRGVASDGSDAPGG